MKSIARLLRAYAVVIVATGFALGAALFPGCSGDGTGLNENGDLLSGAGAGVSFSADIQPLFDQHCTRCHLPGGSGFNATGGVGANGLDLTAGASHESLVNVPTFEEPQVAPRWRVLPGEPDSSYLLQKISSDTPKDGFRMPQDGPPYLTEADILTIEEWIAGGAQEN